MRALKASGDAEGTAALAGQMAMRDEFAAMRVDLLRLQAQSLAKVGRCDHALMVARSLPGPVAAEIRRACRNRGR